MSKLACLHCSGLLYATISRYPDKYEPIFRFAVRRCHCHQSTEARTLQSRRQESSVGRRFSTGSQSFLPSSRRIRGLRTAQPTLHNYCHWHKCLHSFLILANFDLEPSVMHNRRQQHVLRCATQHTLHRIVPVLPAQSRSRSQRSPSTSLLTSAGSP